MIQLTAEPKPGWYMEFYQGDKASVTEENQKIKVGIKGQQTGSILCREIFAKGAALLAEWDISSCTIDLTGCLEYFSTDCIKEAAEGILLGLYQQPSFPQKEVKERHIFLYRADGFTKEQATTLEQSTVIAKGILFARDMVNLPGNKLRPMDFAEKIIDLTKCEGIAAQLIKRDELKAMGMEALTEVGDSSVYPPCLLVLRYLNNPDSQEITGFVGKGVTCDTGGYCLKPAASMAGIKGDMAGGAAVAGAIYALAKNKIKTNVIGCIPICENRISPGSLLPGDVIESFGGKTIEIKNTDAEGRLMLADAVAYAVKREKVTRVVDIATLTGAVVNMLGFSVGGVLSDDEPLYQAFRCAHQTAGERYLRLPFYPEHEKMIQSDVADIKNSGESYCGTITAGLFIRAFAAGLPWLHLDIAGTAWVDIPVFGFQQKGATGAGVSSLYYLLANEEDKG